MVFHLLVLFSVAQKCYGGQMEPGVCVRFRGTEFTTAAAAAAAAATRLLLSGAETRLATPCGAEKSNAAAAAH